MTPSRTRQPVDRAWIDDNEHLIIIDTTDLDLSREGFARQRGVDNVRLKTMLIRLSGLRILNERERSKTGVCGDGMLQLSIARNMNPERIWIEVANAYTATFDRGMEFRNEDPPPYEPPI